MKKTYDPHSPEDTPGAIQIERTAGFYDITFADGGDVAPVLGGSRDIMLTEEELRALLVTIAQHFAEHADL